MTCHEARQALYDAETSRVGDAHETERVSLLVLARAHLRVCIACTDYFERERAFIASLQARFTHMVDPMPSEVMLRVIDHVHAHRVSEIAGVQQPSNVWRKVLVLLDRLRSVIRL